MQYKPKRIEEQENLMQLEQFLSLVFSVYTDQNSRQDSVMT